jgi:F0F1-type ATP synthase delta subunit
MAPKAAPAPPAPKTRELALPMQISSPVEVGRLLREIEAIDDAMLQLQLRKSGTDVTVPKTGQLMNNIVELNKLNLLQETDRKLLHQFLQNVKAKAPVMHMSFSAEPSVAFLEKLMAWFRREIHPLTLLTVGLQPNIGAGCIIRTTNHQFDFSLKQNFLEKRGLLRDQLATRETKA